MNASKALRLVSLLPKSPVEFYDRVMTVVEVTKERGRSASNATPLVTSTEALSVALDVSHREIAEILGEVELGQIERTVSEGITAQERTGPFHAGHNGDFALARSIYVICRLRSPNAVLETGVAYGVTSAFALQALAVNQKGALFSIDLPPLGKEADQHVGSVVPQKLRERWHLYRGTANRVLPKVLSSIGQLDLFVHDSLHTCRNMTFEFSKVWPCLRPRAVLIADDVGLNDAFHDFAAEVKPSFAAVMKEENKDAQFGIMVKPA
ncbi:MAG: class I SAM-dependent methyltransferase [Candidatus Sulfotelmatobacter sp.]